MKVRSLSAVAVLVAGAMTFLGAVVLGGGANAATSNGGYKIMPLGDSITYGFNSSGGGYRPTLWKDLVGAGATVDFVGSVSDNPPANGLGDGDHEGHSGWTTQQIYDNITNWQKTYQPQTILLHIGTNDITNNNATAAATLLGSLVDRILANHPSVNLFVAEIIPLSYSSGDNVAKQFNSTIPSMVASRAAKGSKVYVVDMHSALTTSDLSDAVHPNNTGYAKMGDAWFNAMKQHPESYGKGGSTTTTTTTSSSTSTTTTPPQDGVVLQSTFEDGTTGGWTGRASEQLSVSTTAHSGSRALAVAGRSSSWNGPSLDVTSVLRSGSTYYLSAWVRLASGESATTATLSVQRTSSGTTAYDHVVADVAVTADGWTQLTGSYTVPSDATAVSVYVELASASAGLLLDDVVASTSPITTTTSPTTTSITPTTTTTTTKPTSTKTTKTKETTTVKKCKTGKNGKKTCKTVTKTVKAGAVELLLPDFVTES